MNNKTNEEVFNDLNNIISNYFSENKFKCINDTEKQNDFIEIKINVLERTSTLDFKNKRRSHILV